MTTRDQIKQAIDLVPEDQLPDVLSFIHLISCSPYPQAIAEILEDLRDIQDSELSLAEGAGVDAEEFFRELGV
jgi:hypothetical protein